MLAEDFPGAAISLTRLMSSVIVVRAWAASETAAYSLNMIEIESLLQLPPVDEIDIPCCRRLFKLVTDRRPSYICIHTSSFSSFSSLDSNRPLDLHASRRRYVFQPQTAKARLTMWFFSQSWRLLFHGQPRNSLKKTSRHMCPGSNFVSSMRSCINWASLPDHDWSSKTIRINIQYVEQWRATQLACFRLPESPSMWWSHLIILYRIMLLHMSCSYSCGALAPGEGGKITSETSALQPHARRVRIFFASENWMECLKQALAWNGVLTKRYHGSRYLYEAIW